MPTIPVSSAVGYVGVFLLIAGFFFVVTGLNILKVEKLTVATGRKTWGFGIFLVVAGVLFLLPEISRMFPSATSILLPAPTEISSPTPTSSPTSTPSLTPTDTPTATPTNTSTPDTPTPTMQIFGVVQWLGQDGTDIAVSGCSNGVLGPRGIIDNHIRIVGIRNPERLKQVDLYDDLDPAGHWRFPCTAPLWNIEVQQTEGDQLDLYFESNTIRSVPTTYHIILEFTDGTQTQFEVNGLTGICCRKQ